MSGRPIQNGEGTYRVRFQEIMDGIFKDEEGVLWYLGDILIHGGLTKEEHQRIVEEVLRQGTLGKVLDTGAADKQS